MVGNSAHPMPIDAPDEIGSDNRWRSISLFVLGSLLAAAAAAWLGYRNHLGAEFGPPSGNSAASAAGKLSTMAPPASTSEDPKQRVDRVALHAAPPGTGPAKLAWPIWEFRLRQPIPPRDPSLTPPTWRLIGSSFSAGKWSIIVLRQGTTAPEYFSVGQELPGGYRIEAINDQDVTLVQGKRVMVLSYIGSR